ncbi:MULTISPECIES: pyridoxal phosphate-dependent aminotransferase [Clostridium]|uniref:pyridoxal phosphate-dependent aminotransferase n=1 Tax=Clostridium TaxID=1485 RepID=UPI000406C984|nr:MULTISPECIES: pyridoxal phosphate-dependent aminotransferase [Clostridium]MDB2153538.1 pyridoxal phosphate-dependent aminotransferase [Clostridium butyricum]MDU1068694.1 pyridoxal phosphate-dependent aminotransferase [Clostridium sp.]MDU1336937.1 pyridoxal phosphate-dependent aminotransferase [Clostridium butyricum]MDU2676278.1 pyridoxal phosphate-dependent aminotransferase [Clostridium sp.]MDU4210685.1 pyridoxal phosphate-dependent aminotransferase [Clostridium sp.]
MNLSKKAGNISPSITLSITAKANELKAQGVDVVSFGAGEPDFNTPQNIINAAIKAMQDGKTKYTPAGGILELKKTICKKFKEDNGLDYTTDQITISTGAKQCLANVFMAILNPGDEILIPIPYWVSYPELVKLADGVPVFVETLKENNYKYTIEDLEKAVSDKTKAVLINSPNNPTGTIYNREELIEIAEFAKKHDLLIISDEIYEKLIYDGEKHISIASLSEDAFERTVVINGVSKTYAMTGWRLGYMAASKEITKLMTSIQSHMTSNVNTIAQYAAIEALNGPIEDLNTMVKEFERRRNFMVDRLGKIDGVSIIKPSGAFYIMVNISSYFNTTFKGEEIKNSLDFSRVLLDEEKVAVIPGAGFGLDEYIRLSYATSMDIIETGIDRIAMFINKIK